VQSLPANEYAACRACSRAHRGRPVGVHQLVLDGRDLSPYQRETPETWRPEGPRSYIGASLLHVLAAIGIACLFTLMVRFNVAVFAIGFRGILYFAVCIWGVLALPILLESALFIRLHRLVVLGQLLDWLSTSLLASIVAGLWLRR